MLAAADPADRCLRCGGGDGGARQVGRPSVLPGSLVLGGDDVAAGMVPGRTEGLQPSVSHRR